MRETNKALVEVCGPLQPEIVVQELSRFRGQRQKAGLVALAAHADLRFRQQQIVAIQIQDFLRAESLQQHQSDDGQVP